MIFNDEGRVPLESVGDERESVADVPLNTLSEGESSEDEFSQRSSSQRALSQREDGFLYIIVSWLMTSFKFGKFTTSENNLAKSNGSYSYVCICCMYIICICIFMYVYVLLCMYMIYI